MSVRPLAGTTDAYREAQQPAVWATEERDGQGEALLCSKVLIATDGSEAAFRAGEYAVRLAGTLGAKLYVLYAVDTHRAFVEGIHYGEAVGELTRAGRADTARVKALADGNDVACEELMAEGDPARAIVGVAGEVGADLMVVGRETMSRLERTLFGDVSAGVLRLSDRPVLVVGGDRPHSERSAGG